MKKTLHLGVRMSQRGLTWEMIELVLEYGVRVRECVVMTRDHAAAMLAELRAISRRGRLAQAPPPYRPLKQILDKGGLVVVELGGCLVTAYAYTGRRRYR